MPKKEYIAPTTVHEARYYSHAVKVGNTIYIAGEVGVGLDSHIVPGGFEAQARQAHENIRLILESVGGSMNDIVKMNTYLVNLDNRRVLSGIRREYFPGPNYPAGTAVQVAALAHPDFLLEIEAIAVLDSED